ncbi:MAG: FecR family protein [Dictyoglomus sp.]|nr:FecR family protein [Dictyoglomus sp.]MCX7942070.1 FecR family protein [Dictyoglomaceae bacterium]MDW8188961.1 FecR family protein [Dictyoglomus sp.]
MRRSLILFIILFFLFFIFPIYSQARGYAVITSLKGNVLVKREKGETFIPAKLSMTLYEGDRLWVKENSFAVLTFSDKSVLRVFPNSQVDIVKLLKDKEKECSIFKLLIGKLWVSVERVLNIGERIEVQASLVVAGVRGTSWVVEVKEDGRTIVSVLEGVVSLKISKIEYKKEEERVKSVIISPFMIREISEGSQIIITSDGKIEREERFKIRNFIKNLEKELEVKPSIIEKT